MVEVTQAGRYYPDLRYFFFLTTFGPPVFLPWGGKKYTVRVGVGTLVDNQEWISTRASLPHLGRANLVANL